MTALRDPLDSLCRQVLRLRLRCGHRYRSQDAKFGLWASTGYRRSSTCLIPESIMVLPRHPPTDLVGSRQGTKGRYKAHTDPSPSQRPSFTAIPQHNYTDDDQHHRQLHRQHLPRQHGRSPSRHQYRNQHLARQYGRLVRRHDCLRRLRVHSQSVQVQRVLC